MSITRIEPAAGSRRESMGRHPTALGGRLDAYLGSVVAALRDNGIAAGDPRRTDPADRLVGTVALDCAAVRTAGGPAPVVPAPVVAVWDEQEGWCVGLDGDPVSRRYLHPDLLPAAQTVADFVVDLALGRSAGADRPLGPSPPARPHLRLVR